MARRRSGKRAGAAAAAPNGATVGHEAELWAIQVGDEDARSRDVLGRIYEYLLSQFASAEGKKGGELYTPRIAENLTALGFGGD